MKHQYIFILFVWGVICGQARAYEPGAHVHGVATLQVTQDQNTLSLDLDSPLDNFLGFEHAPGNTRQKQAVQRMIEKLRQPETLFVLTAAAQCTAAPVHLKVPVLNLGKTEKGDPAKDSDHAEIAMEITFHCRMPAALKDMEIKLFDAFPGIHRLDAQVVGPRGQSAAKVTIKHPRLSW